MFFGCRRDTLIVIFKHLFIGMFKSFCCLCTICSTCCIEWVCQERDDERSSFNELDILGGVWSVEYIKHYLFGKSFIVIANYRALLSTMKDNRYNKSHNSRLTRWVKQFSPFDFNIEQIPSAKMELVDYIFCQPNKKAKLF